MEGKSEGQMSLCKLIADSLDRERLVCLFFPVDLVFPTVLLSLIFDFWRNFTYFNFVYNFAYYS